ncbi:NUDIX hydrolase [Teredinibacter turnerae]|uniref:Hydrolase, NUDIX family n=1 Tax=Teredinibacter turnerae (strain ATCC 39867 / T7901) TaxID=377629 RepID=C5BKF4_TERTT|nr:NUDIX domain-containing protein [Teredinibacter turnerae]ACR13347.1 hydrolase, NUDIX family [Teredinibacter turnerae T7901]
MSHSFEHGSEIIQEDEELEPFPPPEGVMRGLSIDNLIFGLDGNELKILLIKHGEGIRKGHWALPGGWIKLEEDLREAATRLLKDLTGISHPYLEQLKTFGKVDRYPAERVVTIAYYALVSADDYALMAGFSASDAAWYNIHDTPPVVFDHQHILDYGIDFLKHQVRHKPIGFNLLPEKFTLLQLQELYEAILDIKLDKPNFRRKIMKMNLLKPCNEKQQGVAHRAANLYRFDKDAYEKLTEQGFTFEV